MHLHKLSVRLSGAVFLLLAAAAPTAAADRAEAPATESTAAEGAAVAQAAKPAEPKKICQTIESSAGRIAAKRVCMTKEEWRHVKFD